MSERIIDHALIMAAGRGNRMRPLTDSIPKPMVRYKGDTLIGNSLKALAGCVTYVHITVGYKKAMLSEYLMSRGVDTILNTEGHGNGWWVTHTLLRHLDAPVLVLTTDNITEIDIDFLTREYVRLGRPHCMLVPVRPIPGIAGDYITHQDGLVTAVDRAIPTEIYCSGIQVLNPARVAAALPGVDDNFYTIWNGLIALGQLKVSAVYPKAWFSVDTLEQALGLEE